MEYGVMLPFAVRATRSDVLGWATAAEAADFRTVTTGERMAYENWDQTVVLAAAAAVTTKVRLLSNVTLVPLHDAGLLAKQMASLDVVSEGRFVMAAGVGSRKSDYRDVPDRHKTRWAHCDETVRTMKRLWNREELVQGDGPIGPTPYTQGGPEIWYGGRGPKALRMAARWGATGFAGWTHTGDLAELKRQVAAVNEAWADAGRTDRPYLFMSSWFALGDDADRNIAEMTRAYYAWEGSAQPEVIAKLLDVRSEDAVLRLIDRVQEAGFDELNFLPVTADIAEFHRLQAVVSKR